MGLISHWHVAQRLKMCIAVFISINCSSHGLLWREIFMHHTFNKTSDLNLLTNIRINSTLFLQTTSHCVLLVLTLLHSLQHKCDQRRITYSRIVYKSTNEQKDINILQKTHKFSTVHIVTHSEMSQQQT